MIVVMEREDKKFEKSALLHDKLNNKIMIAPSILSADFAIMGKEVENLEKCGADIIHVDVMDGVFVPNITFGIKMVEDIFPHTKLPLDSHLMIVEPWKYIEKFAKAGSSFITVHYEACGDRLSDTLSAIRSLGVKCGLVINPDTPVKSVANLIEKCDMILLMSVFPGFGGQKFISQVLDKIREVRQIVDSIGKDILIEVDGGINTENCGEIKTSGANVLVAGSTIFKADDRAFAIKALREN